MIPGQIIKTFTSKKGSAVTIRYPRWEDLDAVTEFANGLVEEDTFIALNEKQSREQEAKWMAETFEQIETGKKIQVVAEVNGDYAGNCEIRVHDRRSAHVGDIGIALAKNFRGQGVGEVLLTSLIAEGKKAGLKLLILHCFENNDRAIRLYEKLGFIRAGLIPGMHAYKGAYAGEVTLFLPFK